MQKSAYYEYVEFDGERFFTVVLLPEPEGRFPTVIFRSPYVQRMADESEDSIVQNYVNTYDAWLKRGYAIVYQHCKGQGKSTGAFVPYVHEREDGLALRQWIRKQPFYNGELYLLGGSYSSSLHYCTAPFETDIKGAVFEVQDTERYRLWYRNGQMRKGHANWHFELYKNKCGLNKSFSMDSFSQLPLVNLSERVLGDRAEDFEQMLAAESPTDAFWSTRFGGVDAKDATDNANIPILFTTGYNDFYVGGIFKMWNRLDAQTKDKCALLVSPYNHGDGHYSGRGLSFEMGKRSERFGSSYQIDWFDHIRKGTPVPYKIGEITYYRTFESTWGSGFYDPAVKELALSLGNDPVSFTYDPQNPPRFCEEGSFQQDFSCRSDVITLYTYPFDRDVFIRGQMKAVLTVCSDCADTTFYMNISIQKPNGDYALRHDITSLCYQLGDYAPNTKVELHFVFDEYAFLLKKGERLRIDIASTDDGTYVCHTNKKGPYYLQTEVAIATNTVYLEGSRLFLPIEE